MEVGVKTEKKAARWWLKGQIPWVWKYNPNKLAVLPVLWGYIIGVRPKTKVSSGEDYDFDY